MQHATCNMQHATRNKVKEDKSLWRWASFFILFFALVFFPGCEDEILNIDNNKKSSTEYFQVLAKELSTSDFLKNIEHQDDGENLFAKTKDLNMGNVSLRSSLSSIIDSTLLANPLLTLAYPSLDYYPNETVNEHSALIDYVLWLPQDYEVTGTVQAYDTTGTLVTIDAVNYDTTARYCVIKNSEEYVALNEGLGETSFGDPIPSSEILGEIPVEFEIGSWDLYYTQDIYNAFAYDNEFGDDTSVLASEYFDPNADISLNRIARENYIRMGGNGSSGSGGTANPRSPCSCEESTWERDCDKDFDVLNRINVGSRDATWKIEHWTDGPKIEFRAIYYVWIRSLGSFSEVNIYITGKRHEFHGKWPLVNRTITLWEKPTVGEPNIMPTKWLEEPKYEEPRPISFTYDGNSVSTLIIPETFELGDYLIPYSDPYCEGEKYKVWSYINSNKPNDGFFFEEIKRQ